LPFEWLHSWCAAVLFKLFCCFYVPFISHLQGEKCIIAYCVMIHGCWFVYTNSKKKVSTIFTTRYTYAGSRAVRAFETAFLAFNLPSAVSASTEFFQECW
jgi:hypothetical protein